MTEAKVVKNQSSGYGYKYSNLADLAKAGINIPKMRIKANEFGEFVEYYDPEEKIWHQGARVVAFEGKGMNAAQAYGAALTYARRYTVQMAEAVACDDDNAVEKAKPVVNNKFTPKTGTGDSTLKPTDKQLWLLKKLLGDAEKREAYLQAYQMLIADPSNNLMKIKEYILPKALPELDREELNQIISTPQGQQLVPTEETTRVTVEEPTAQQIMAEDTVPSLEEAYGQ